MKRSQINEAIRRAEALLARHDIPLPQTARWRPEDWRAHADQIETIRQVMMGWDVTDFGTGDFDRVGAALYTVRNGLLDEPEVGVPYCEKYIVMKEGQRLEQTLQGSVGQIASIHITSQPKMPFGFLLPIVQERLKSPVLTVFAGFLFSAGIETMQYITGRGLTEVDDVMNNTIGSAVGVVIYEVLLYLFRKRSQV